MTATPIEILSLTLFAYLLGSLSSAILLSKLMGFPDPRAEGSHNPGATNVLRIAGRKAAFFTLLGDCLKGLLPVLLAHWLVDDRLAIAITGFSAFLGHCYPVFFGFRGGKGVATAIAATLAFDWISGGALIALWLVLAKGLRISSLAAIISFTCLPALIYWRESSLATLMVFIFMSSILIWRHKSNIQRLLQGSES